MVTYANSQNATLKGTNYYTGLGGRYLIADSTSSRWQTTDGETATSPLLYDGMKYYNPGLGEYSSQYARYYDYNEDDLGSVVGLFGQAQLEVQGYADDAFGNDWLNTGSTIFTIGQIDGFGAANGYQTDNDAGLIHTGNRYYIPYFGRFVTQDPAGDGSNWYSYCRNDPTRFADPSGFVEEREGRRFRMWHRRTRTDSNSRTMVI